jgi:hypothetical protein
MQVLGIIIIYHADLSYQDHLLQERAYITKLSLTKMEMAMEMRQQKIAVTYLPLLMRNHLEVSLRQVQEVGK